MDIQSDKPRAVEKRRVIEVPGLHHGDNPIPLASRHGPLVASGGVLGMDPATGEVPDDLDRQCALMFDNVRRIVEAAGGSADDIVRMTVWLKDRAGRAIVNREWLTMFPDPASRPARHTLVNDHFQGPVRIQCDFLAYVSPGA